AAAYYTGWQALPWVGAQLAGRGAYALSRAGRSAFGRFPEEVADDRYVTTRFAPEEAAVVPGVVVVRPPSRIADVVRVRRRVYAGNLTVAASTHDFSRGTRLRALVRVVIGRPRLAPSLAVFAATTTVAKLAARRDAKAGHVSWGRDEARGVERRASPS